MPSELNTSSSLLLHLQSSRARTAKLFAIWASRPKFSLMLGVVSNKLPKVLYHKLNTWY